MTKFGDELPESSGGKYPDVYDLTITHADFAPDANYNKGESLLLWWNGIVEYDTNTYTEGVPDFFGQLSYGLPKVYDTNDGGKTIFRTDGKDEGPAKNSVFGKLITHCVNDLGLVEVLSQRGSIEEAKVWEGLKFRIDRKYLLPKYDATARAEVPKETPWPIQFLGVVSEQATAGVGVNSAPATNGNGTADLRTKVLAALKGAETPEAGQSAALSIPGVTQNDELLNGIISGSLYAEANA